MSRTAKKKLVKKKVSKKTVSKKTVKKKRTKTTTKKKAIKIGKLRIGKSKIRTTPRQSTEKTINSLAGYMKFIESYCDDDLSLFRGQNSDDDLVPTIGRINLRNEFLKTEKIMISDFKRKAIPFLSSEPKNEWEWLSIAQHHGLATRLLDWTENPLASLWFCVNRPPKDNYGVVWIFNPPENDIINSNSKESPYLGRRTQVFKPNHIAKRIISQGGWFTVHKFIPDKNAFIPLNKNRIYIRYLKKIIIPSECFSEIRYNLDRCNVNAASLFPDIDGLLRHIQWQNSLLKDEQEQK